MHCILRVKYIYIYNIDFLSVTLYFYVSIYMFIILIYYSKINCALLLLYTCILYIILPAVQPIAIKMMLRSNKVIHIYHEKSEWTLLYMIYDIRYYILYIGPPMPIPASRRNSTLFNYANYIVYSCIRIYMRCASAAWILSHLYCYKLYYTYDACII